MLGVPMRSKLELVVAVGVALIVLSVLRSARADHEPHNRTVPSSTNSALVTLTINPEARVSVMLSGGPPPEPACGTAAALPIRIVNQGFVTAVLEARLIGKPARGGVKLTWEPRALSGDPEEVRVLGVVLFRHGSTDVTIAFNARGEGSDPGGRDRLHVLMSCR